MALDVLLFVGYLGAGKTTVVRRVTGALHAANDAAPSGGPVPAAVHVIVNDFAAHNVDAGLLRSSSSGGGAVIDMHGGCVCCTLLPELVAAVEAVARNVHARVEAAAVRRGVLIIEATGIADAAPIVGGLRAAPWAAELGLRLHSVVCVVDAATFLASSTESQRPLLEAQCAVADVIAVNKISTVSAKRQAKVLAAVGDSGSECWACDFGDLGPRLARLLDPAGGLFQLPRFEAAAAALEAKERAAFGGRYDGVSEADRYGFTSTVLVAAAPLDAARLLAAVESGAALEGVCRSKGYCWVSGPDGPAQWQWASVGRRFEYAVVENGPLMVPPPHGAVHLDDAAGPDPVPTHLVLIGTTLVVDALVATFTACLAAKP